MIATGSSTPLCQQLDYYRARAAEYDQWWLRQGRYDRGAVLNAQWFTISCCQKIASYEPIAALRHLRRLELSDCASMPDLKWTEGMDQLDIFSFVETNVEDGDLSPLLQLPKLRHVGTSNKKHYNYQSETLNEMLSQRVETGGSNGGRSR